MLAILNMGAPEVVVVLVIGVLLFGRRLPEVGRSVGHTVAKLRKGVMEFKDQIDKDDDLRDVRDSVREIHGELRSTIDAPKRALRNTVLGTGSAGKSSAGQERGGAGGTKPKVDAKESGILSDLTDPDSSTPAPKPAE